MLGVMEGGSKEASQEMYHSGKAMVNAIRQDIGEPDLPIFWTLPGREENCEYTRAAVKKISNDLPRVMIINYDEKIHYTLEQYLAWADTAVATIDEYDQFPKTNLIKSSGMQRPPNA